MVLRKLTILLLALFSACSTFPEISDFTPAERQFVFCADDVRSLIPPGFQIKQNRYGKDSTYVSSFSKLNGFGFTWSQHFVQKDNEIEFRTQCSIQPNADRAIQLFKSDKVSPTLYKNYVLEKSPADYGADELFLAIGENTYFISLRRGRINYSISIIGISLREMDIKPRLLSKLAFLEQNPMDSPASEK
jgi:hypothetical protein